MRWSLSLVVVVAWALPCVEGAVFNEVGVFWSAPFLVVLVAILSRAFFKKHLGKLTLLLVSLSLGLCVVDLSLRRLPVVERALYYRPDDQLNFRLPSYPKQVRYEEDQEFKGAIHGDLSALSGIPSDQEARTVRFTTDSLGFRNDGDAASQELDVIVLGDSFGMGSGTTQEETLAAHLKADYGLTVYNLSTPGNPWNEWVDLVLTAPKLKLRTGTMVLWLLFSGNDLENRFGDKGTLPEEEGFFKRLETRLATFRKRSVIRLAFKRLLYKTTPEKDRKVLRWPLPAGEDLLVYEPYAAVRERSLKEVKSLPNSQNLEAVFQSMKRFASKQGLCVAVAVIPTKAEVYYPLFREKGPTPESTGFSEAVKRLCEKAGFPFLDLLPGMGAEARTRFEKDGRLLWWRDDTHWNGLGHATAAKLVYEGLLKPLLQAGPPGDQSR